MALVNILKSKTVEGLKLPGMYSDGSGLYLQIGPTGSKSWLYRYKVMGRQRHLGLGPYPSVSLAIARDKAADARHLRKDGIDPLDAKRAAPRPVPAMLLSGRIDRPSKVMTPKAGPDAKTFRWCADQFLEALVPTLANAKHAKQWKTTLHTYAGPICGEVAIGDVTRQHVIDVLSPIWLTKPEQAFKLRGRMERVLEYAISKDWRPEPNPAAWSRIKAALPSTKDRVRSHHGSMPFKDIPKFVVDLRAAGGLPELAFELLILTAVRTRELLHAAPDEFDLDAGLWSIPAGRMKMGVAHRVPLAPRAVEIVRQALEHSDGVYLFPGRRPGKPFSDMIFLMALRRMGREATGHGFRSSFKNWAAEETTYPDLISELALAHQVGSAVERAYLRTDLLEKRRALMTDWANFAGSVDNL